MKKRNKSRLQSVWLLVSMLFGMSVHTWAASYDVIKDVTVSGNTFTITRTDASAPTIVYYRTVDGSALGGVHFKHQSDWLYFGTGETEKKVEVSTMTVKDINSYGNTDRVYGLEAWNDFSETKSAQTSIANSKSFSKVGDWKDIKLSDVYITDSNKPKTNCYIYSYFSDEDASRAATGQDWKYYFYITFHFEEIKDGFFRFSVGTSGYSDPWGGNDKSAALGTALYATSWENTGNFEYPYYANNSSGTIQYGTVSQSGVIKNSKYLTTSMNGVSDLYFMFDASGNDADNGKITNFYVHAKCVDDVNPTVKNVFCNTMSHYSYGDSVTVAVQFDEVVSVDKSSTPTLTTNMGKLSYKGGDGTNVLYFSGKLSQTSDVSGLTVQSISGKVTDLVGNSMNSFNEKKISDFKYRASRATGLTCVPDVWSKSIKLSWKGELSTKDEGSWNVYRYKVEDGPLNSGYTLIAKEVTQTSYTDKDETLLYNKDYEYMVEFVPSAWENNSLLVTRHAVQTTQLATDYALKAKLEAYDNYLRIVWENTPFGDKNNHSFQIYRCEGENGTMAPLSTSGITVSDNTQTEYSYVDKEVSSGCATYCYYVETSALFIDDLNPSGVRYRSDTVKGMLTSSSQVTSVTASKGMYSATVKLSWNAIQTGEDATSYIVYRRKLGTTDDWVQIYNVSGTQETYSYDDNTAVPGEFYEYKVSSSFYCSETNSMTSPVEKTDEGYSRCLGVISGRVTYGTGVAVEGVRVLASRSSADDEAQFYALRSNGVGGGLQVPLTVEKGKKYFVGTPWSIQLYVNPDDSIANANGKYGKAMLVDCYRNFGLYLTASSTANYYTVGILGPNDADSVKASKTKLEIPAHSYSHLTFSYDGGKTFSVSYVNDYGEVETVTSTFNATHFVADNDTASTSNLYFGAAANGVDIFKGYIDELRIFSGKQLTNAEILNNYNHTMAGTESKMVLYIPMDEGISGQRTAYDYSKTSGVTNDNHAKVLSSSVVTSKNVPGEDQLGLFGITDEYGNYTISGIPFSGDGTTYMVTPTLGIHKFSPTYATRYVSASSMVHSGVDFEDVSSFTVKGTVAYYNTNYPVKGANLYVDGTVCSKDGELIKTNDDGEFTISVPIGDHHIQVKMSDHVFVSEGRYPSNPLLEHTFDQEMSNLTFFDSTFVVLTGRVAGGAPESEKAHGFGLGKATIGKATITLSAGSKYQMNLDAANVRTFDSPTDAVSSVTTTGKFDNGDDARIITIHTDSSTGEFAVMVPPVDLMVNKVAVDNDSEITFSTDNLESILLETGSLTEQTDSMVVAEGDTATFSYMYALDLIYRSSPVLKLTSMSTPDGAFGDEYYVYEDDALGVKDSIALYSVDTVTGDITYTFGYPLFTQASTYAQKMYLYEPYENHDSAEVRVTEVPLTGAEVFVSNSIAATMVATSDGVDEDGNEIKAGQAVEDGSSTLTVDSTGYVDYAFQATYPNIVEPYTLGMNINFIYDGASYAWDQNGVFAGIVTGGLTSGSNFITAGPDKVLFVLRDPPGTGSSAYLEKGQTITTSAKVTTEYNSEYKALVTYMLGAEIQTSTGLGFAVITENSTKANISGGTEISYDKTHERENTYTLTTTERVSTSSEQNYVGEDGDLFIGSATNIITGKARKVAPVRNEKDSTYSIQMFEGFSIGEELTTQFKYTQNYIENVLIPNMVDIRNSLLTTVPSSEYKKTYPNKTGKSIYITKLSSDDDDFGTPGTYLCIPADPANYTDTVGYFNTQIGLWETQLALNEQAKVTAIECKLEYNEDEYDNAAKKIEEAKLLEQTCFLLYDPYVQHNVKLDSAFWFNKKGGTIKYSDYGTNKAMINNILDNYSISRSEYEKYLSTPSDDRNITLFYDTKKYGWKVKNTSFDSGSNIEESVQRCGSTSATDASTTKGLVVVNGKTGFSICGIGFEVELETKQGGTEGFSGTSTTETCTTVGYTLAEDGDDDALSIDVFQAPDGFGPIFYTRAGQTTCPYEDEKLTRYYQPGEHTLAVKTSQIEIPRITVGENNLEAQKLIDIPSGSAANFTLNLDNLSETSENVWYMMYVVDESNPYGAALSIDGVPFSTSRSTLVNALETTHKNLQIKQSRQDIMKYDSIAVVLASTCQYDGTDIWEVIADTVYLSAEFVPSCSPITLQIDDKTMNTSTGDTLQLVVKDYEKEYLNFNEIRIQYKGERDNDWNLAKRLYVDSLDGATEYVSFPMSSNLFNDQTYQFRVLSVCESGSNSVVTRESETIDVIKDMNSPRVLGTPNPSDGILDAGDEISVTFNEDIQNTLLSEADNFVVQAILNDAEVDHDVALKLDSTSSFAASTEADVVLANKSFSVDMWVNLASGGTLLEHSSSTESFVMSVGSTGKLTFNVNGKKVTSSKKIPFNKWCFLTFCYTAGEDSSSISSLVAYDAEQVNLLVNKSVPTYGATSKISVGKNILGAISELTLWNTDRSNVLAQSQMYYQKAPSTENLVGYWKFDEGHGKVALDAARSRNMVLSDDSWYLNNTNYAASLDGKGYLTLDITRSTALTSDDYMVEMWFRGENQENTTLWSADSAVAMKFNASGYLTLMADGVETQLSTTDYLDNAWHHVALNVLRNGTTSIYVDGAVVKQVASSKVPALQSAFLTVGAQRSRSEVEYTYVDNFKGDVDEIRYWLATFNANAIEQSRYSRLNGDEAGLEAYYTFEGTTTDAGQIAYVFDLNDMSANAVGKATAVSVSQATTAPALQAKKEMTDLKFNFVASERTIVLTIDEKASRLEGTTVNFTVKNVRDENNNMSSPVRWSAYINQNRLVWADELVSLEKNVESKATFTATISNQSASTEAWSISGLPTWLSASKTSGSLSAQKSESITFEVSDAVAAGKYEESILLSGNEGINVPLTLNLDVNVNKPDWSVDPSDFENSMSVIAQVKIDGEYTSDTEDVVAAFVNGKCVGVASPVYYSRYDAYFVSMDVYGNSTESGKKVVFKVWDASAGVTYPSLNSSKNVTFSANKLYGSMAEPILLETSAQQEQTIDLKSGWNWISLNVTPSDNSIDGVFGDVAAESNLVKGKSSFSTSDGSAYQGSLATAVVGAMYKVSMKESSELSVIGNAVDASESKVTVKSGWNWIGFNSTTNMSLNEAFAGLNPVDGDMVKGQSGFAYYEGYEWVGTLTALNPGKGYMYKSASKESRTFAYPVKSSSASLKSLVSKESTKTTTYEAVDETTYSGNMTIVARVMNGTTVVENAEVGVFVDKECRAASAVDDNSLVFLTVAGETAGDSLIFKVIYEEDEYVINQDVVYAEDAAMGTLNNPYVIQLDPSNKVNDVLAPSIAVYPTLVENDIHVEAMANNILNCQVTDVAGRMLVETDVNADYATLSVSDLNQGVYVLIVTTDNGQVVKRFTKK